MPQEWMFKFGYYNFPLLVVVNYWRPHTCILVLLDENWYTTHFDSRPALSTRQGLFTACFPRIRTRHVTSPIKFRQPTNPLLHSSTFFRRERRSLCGKLVRRPPKVLKAGILVPSSAGNCMHNRALIHVFNGWSGQPAACSHNLGKGASIHDVHTGVWGRTKNAHQKCLRTSSKQKLRTEWEGVKIPQHLRTSYMEATQGRRWAQADVILLAESWFRITALHLLPTTSHENLPVRVSALKSSWNFVEDNFSLFSEKRKKNSFHTSTRLRQRWREIIRANRKSQVRKCLGFCSADS